MKTTAGALLVLCFAPHEVLAQGAIKPGSLAKAAVVQQPTPTRTPTPVNIGNFVWDDLDGDGRQDAGEPGLAGVTVQLWNPAKSQMIASAVTNGSGIYSVVAPQPGSYRIRVVLPGASDSFSPKDADADDTKDSDVNPSGPDTGFTDVFNIASNVISTTIWDAGIRVFRTPTPTRTPTPVNIGNFVWDDLDGDGRQDAGEPGLAGVTVQLWNPAKSQMIASAVTNGSGIYSVVAPLPGSYRIRVVLPGANDSFSPKDADADDTKDSDVNPSGPDLGFTDVFNIASNVISTTIFDAGIRVFRTPTPTRTPTPVNIGNFVWDDLDGDGRQDAGEPGLAGVTVQLWNPAKSQMIASAVTNGSGIYSVVAPLPGSYRIRVVLPGASDSFSPKDADADDTKDSDVNPLRPRPRLHRRLQYRLERHQHHDLGRRDPRLPHTHAHAHAHAGQYRQLRVGRPRRRRQAGRRRARSCGRHGPALEPRQSQMIASAVTNGSGIYPARPCPALPHPRRPARRQRLLQPQGRRRRRHEGQRRQPLRPRPRLHRRLQYRLERHQHHDLGRRDPTGESPEPRTAPKGRRLCALPPESSAGPDSYPESGPLTRRFVVPTSRSRGPRRGRSSRPTSCRARGRARSR
ncbi:MAG: hypothetical protein IPL89_15345 [Acidobacteria bacterium]|nr:hypothetical protein [Acidobacteriota bacterium]